MDENRTNQSNLIAEFQRLCLETSEISRDLMANTRSVDARRSLNSNPNNEVLKVMNERFEAFYKESEAVQRRLTRDNQNQNRMMKKVLDELRSARIEILVMKKKQEEDRKEMENIKTITSQIQETKNIKNPKIVELCGYWTISSDESPSSNFLTLTEKHHFSEEGNILTWSFWQNGRLHRFPKVRVGSNECKVREDGKIGIRIGVNKFKLEVKENMLRIEYGDMKAVCERSS